MTLRAKRGDTFSLFCERLDDAGVAVSIVGQTITAQLRRGTMVIDLTATPVNAALGTFTLSRTAADAALWADGLYDCDVQFMQGAVVRSTDTFQVEIRQDVTRAA